MANLLDMRINNSMSRAQIPCTLTVWLQMHQCLKGNVEEAWGRTFSLLVLPVFSIYLQGLYVLHNTLRSTLHENIPTVWPVASRSLFLDMQVVTLFGENSTEPRKGGRTVFLSSFTKRR